MNGTDAKGTVLYIGGFELPDKNAAAQRVIGIAKSLRELGYRVVFTNSIKGQRSGSFVSKEYFGFDCIEYGREKESDYLFSAKTALTMIRRVKPDFVIAYNYPAFALDRIRKYCEKAKIRVFADATEWPMPSSRSRLTFKIIKGLDTQYRMKVVHNKLSGMIAISRYLYDYYKNNVNTVLVPPTVDREDEKWQCGEKKDPTDQTTSFVYAGSPSVTKEKLDCIVSAVEKISKKKKIQLHIVGINKEQFIKMYSWNTDLSDAVIFWGRVAHEKAVEIVSSSDWAIILRENNLVVKAGFPTKLVESISCGTPVIINRFSNVEDYLTEKNSLIVEELGNEKEIEDAVLQACSQRGRADPGVFDYRNYVAEIGKLFCESGNKKKD